MALVSVNAQANIYEMKPERGLFWGELPKQEQKEEKKKYPRPIVPSQAEIMEMHPKEVEKLLDETLQYAVYTRKEEDVEAYYRVYDTMRRKAAAFANVSGYVTMKHPELNSRQSYGFTNPSRKAIRKDTNKNIDNLLVGSREDYAIIFLVKDGCPICPTQRNILKSFQDDFGWRIKEVNIDYHPEAIARFNVTTTPLTIIVSKKNLNQWFPVAVGAESLSGLKLNTYRAIRILEGKISAEQYFINENQEGSFFDPKGFKGGVNEN